MHALPIKSTTVATLLAAALLATAVYWPGLAGHFAFDDFAVIVDNDALSLDELTTEALLNAAFSTATGPLKRPLALLSFAIERYFAGLNPRSFKTTNLVIHCLNAALLLFLLRTLLGSIGAPAAGRTDILAGLIVLIWVVHPINASSVLYISQRMTLLAATFSLIALLVYVRARRAEVCGIAVSPARWAVVPLSIALGALCKETALLVPVYILVIEWSIFRTPILRHPLGARRVFLAFLLAAAALGMVMGWSALVAGYGAREFTLGQRLLTECRVILGYVHMTVVPNLTHFALFHDDIVISTSLLQPPATLLALVVVALGCVLVLVRSQPILSFGLGWFLGGHLLESTVVPLLIMQEHRNYLPVIGLLVVLVVLLDKFAERWLAAGLRYMPTLTVLLGVAALTFLLASNWSEPWTQMAVEVHNHPRSAKAQYEYGRLTIDRAKATQDPLLEQVGINAIEQAALLSPIPFLPYSALLKLALNANDQARAEAIISATLAHRKSKVKVEALQQTIECQAYAACRKDPDLVISFAGRVLADPTLSDHRRRRALEWLAIYYLRVLGDVGAGISILRDLVAERPTATAPVLRLGEALASNGSDAQARQIATRVGAMLPWYARFSDRGLYARWRRLEQDVAIP